MPKILISFFVYLQSRCVDTSLKGVKNSRCDGTEEDEAFEWRYTPKPGSSTVRLKYQTQEDKIAYL